jgi:RNA polymerase sigma-70 factor (ECF subfamily)
LLRHLRFSHAEQAEDIAADVWAEVTSLLPRFVGGDAAFRGWVYTLARRRLIDSYRRDGRRRTQQLAANDGDARSSDRPEDEVLARLSIERTVTRLHHLLPRDQAEVLLLRVVGGLTVDEVATITGKQPVNVRVLQHRALRRLADRLEADRRSA